MNKQKIIAAIYNLQKFVESLEGSLYAIKTKDRKDVGHLSNAKNQSSNIAMTIKSELNELRDEFEKDRYDELSIRNTENFLKINSPGEDSRQNIKKILNLKQRLVSNATKSKKTTTAIPEQPPKESK